MMVESSNAFTIRDLDVLAQRLLEEAAGLTTWLINGEMGAGKTTLVKAICKELGVKETVASPTFSIVNEYAGGNGKPIYHFDFYRLKKEAEAYDIGVNEYFESGNLCLVEWAEKIPSLLPDSYFAVNLEFKDSSSRIIYYRRNE